MKEERGNSRCAVQMAGALSLSFHTVDLASPLAEYAFLEDAVQKLNFQIQETELWSLDSPAREFVLAKLAQDVVKIGLELFVFMP